MTTQRVALPFFGLDPLPWVRPPLSAFSTWLNRGSKLANFNNGNPDTPGTGYAGGDTITLAGGTGTPTVLSVTTQVISATIVNAGTLGTPGSTQVNGTTGSGSLFVLDVTIGVGGTITSIDDINNAGNYTTNPTDITNEPVTGSSLTGAVVSVVMGVANASVVNPGSYTVPPTSPTSQASTSGSGTGATFTTQFTKIASATDNANGLPLVIQGGCDSNFDCLTALLKTAPAPPWTIVSGVAAFSNVLGTIVFLPIVLYDSVHDKAETFWWYGAAGTVTVHRWDGTITGASSTPSQISNDAGFQFSDYIAWFKVEHDGTNLTFSISPEGVLFMPIYSEVATSFLTTIDKVGFGFDRKVGGSIPPLNDQASILWGWKETSP